MKIKNIYLVLLAIVTTFTSCVKYDDFTEDFDYTTVSFGTQRPLRTIVSYDDMEFQVGVNLGGKRTNGVDEYATFEIDETLLDTIDGADSFTLLPESYYSLSDDSQMIISAGGFIGDVTVTLDRDLFTNDALSTSNTYALPLRITDSSVDSILSTKNYTVLVVKYISQYSGAYYHKGAQKQIDVDGSLIEEIVYNELDLINHDVWEVSTVDRNSILTPGIGAINTAGFVLNIDEATNAVSVDTLGAGVTELTGSGTVEDDRSIVLDYSFTHGGNNYQVNDTLILRQAVERDLRFEEWVLP